MAGKIKNRVGIDIGSNSIKLVSYNLKKNSDLSRLAKVNLVSEDRVQHPDEVDETHLANALTELLQDVPNNKSSIRVCLTAARNNVFIIQLPKVSENEIKQALFWELGPLLPNPVKEYEYDYKVLKHKNSKDEMYVLVGVYRRDRMDRIMKIIRGLGKDIDILETDTLPAIDLYLTTTGGLVEPIGFLQLGAAHSQYTVLIPGHHPGFLFIPFGGNTLNDLIMKQKEVPFLTAESLRHKGNEKVSKKRSWQYPVTMKSALEDALEGLANKVIRYNVFHQQKTEQIVKKIIVTGGLLNDKFVAQTLLQDSKFFGVPCEFWDPTEDFFPKQLLKQHPPFHFSTALSLALI